MSSEGQWLTITEYSTIKKLSISTIRRYIKANRVQYKKVNGKYMIFLRKDRIVPAKEEQQSILLALQLRLKEMELENKRLSEENQDLRMLVSLYEKEKKPSLPDLPL